MPINSQQPPSPIPLRPLGSTGLLVSRMALGCLTLGPYQLNYPVEKGAQVIIDAINAGVNVIDTAKAYHVYPYVKKAMEALPADVKINVHVIGRSYDYTYEGMRDSFNEALKEMGLERIAVFMLHETESARILKGHADALRCLVDLKKQGLLAAAGISTHHVAGVRAAAECPDVDVIFAILNAKGVGIMDGSREDMENALRYAHKQGKGILIMKAMAGGHLYKNARDALRYVADLPFADCVVLGMQDRREIEYNAAMFAGEDVADALPGREGRRIFIEPWCCGCGICVQRCPFGALEIKEGRAVVDHEKCMLCSYCAGACGDFCVKIV